MKKKLLILCSIFIGLNTTYGQNGNSLHFDGINDNVSIDLPSVFNDITNNDFTIEAWFKPTTGSVITPFYAQFDSNNQVNVLFSSSGKIFFYVIESGVLKSIQTNTTFLPSGQWSHVAFTWDASLKELNVYINGVLETDTSPGGSTGDGTNNKLILGQIPNSGLFYNGNIDEFRIWDKVRTQVEIASDLNNELTLPQTNLINYYKFNQGVVGADNSGVTTLSDALNTNNGTLNNFALNGATSNWVDGTVLSINDYFNKTELLKLYPNPSNNFIQVSGLSSSENYKIYNYLGEKVHSGILSNQEKINVKKLSAGLYILQFDKQRGIKFIKE